MSFGRDEAMAKGASRTAPGEYPNQAAAERFRHVLDVDGYRRESVPITLLTTDGNHEVPAESDARRRIDDRCPAGGSRRTRWAWLPFSSLRTPFTPGAGADRN